MLLELLIFEANVGFTQCAQRTAVQYSLGQVKVRKPAVGIRGGKQNDDTCRFESPWPEKLDYYLLHGLFFTAFKVSRKGKVCPFRKNVRKQQHDDQLFSDIGKTEVKFNHFYIMKRPGTLFSSKYRHPVG